MPTWLLVAAPIWLLVFGLGVWSPWRRRPVCGSLAPVDAHLGMVTCVLDPCHEGSHQDRDGERWPSRVDELESQNKRLRSAASRALERCDVATDPSGAADEAARILAEVVQLDGRYVPWDRDKPMFDAPVLDSHLRAGRFPRP